MDPTDIHTLTGAEEEIAENLAANGVRMAAARILVFLSRTDGAFGAEIARGTVKERSLVWVALRQLMEQGWVDSYRDMPGTRKIKGQRYSLAGRSRRSSRQSKSSTGTAGRLDTEGVREPGYVRGWGVKRTDERIFF